ncbi:hypothetical protein Btru_016239 [Bulinus truncatus]|nr:hypothetical protein Btru_016239 [Bulinus truncatus]
MNESSNNKKSKKAARAAKNREKKELEMSLQIRKQQEALEELQRELKCDRRIRCANNGADDDLLFNAVTNGNFVDVKKVFQKENETCSQEILDKCLLLAAKSGQKLTLTLLLKSGANTNYRDELGDTPLMVSAEQGHLDIVRILKDNKADINAINNGGDTALIRSVHSRSCAELTRLLVSKINVNLKNQEGGTALIKAIQIGDIDIIKVLVMNGAVTENLVDNESLKEMVESSGLVKFIDVFRDCKTPAQPSLIAAVKTRDIDLIETILTLEPDNINLRDSTGDTALDTLLKLIIVGKSTVSEVEKNIIKLLISRGVEVKRQSKKKSIGRNRSAAKDCTLVKAVQVGDLDVVKWLCISGAQINESVVNNQLTPLMMAAREGFMDILNYLLSKQASIDVKNSMGTALDIAVKSGRLECAKRLLEEKANKDLKAAYKMAIEYKNLHLVKYLVETFTIDLQDMSFMEWAIEFGMKNIVEYLIKQGMDVNASIVQQSYSYRGHSSPIHLCVRKSALDLVQSGANVNAVNNSGKTPLFCAVDCKMVDHVRLLLEYGALVNVFDSSQDTPLSRAIDVMSFEIVCLLIDSKADTGITLKNGKTYLMHTLRSRHYYSYYAETKHIFNKLLTCKIDVNKQDDNGNTALIKACEESLAEAVELLLNHGADVNLTNNEGQTALSHSIRSDGNITKMLLMRKAKFCSPRECQQVLPLFIYEKKEDLIPLSIGQGAYPHLVKGGYSSEKLFNSSYMYGQDLTPLSIAIYDNRIELARYFIKRRFLTKYDVTDILSKDFFQTNFLKANPGDLFRNLLSLQTLTFVTVSDLLGATPEREVKVEKLPIPNKIKQRLLFRDSI